MLWGFLSQRYKDTICRKARVWSPLGLTYAVGVDGVSLAYILIVTSCVPLLCCFTTQKSKVDTSSNYLLS